MSVNTKCSRECIEYISRYKEIVHAKTVAEAEYKRAEYDFDEVRKAQLREKIAGYDEILADIESVVENYAPSDVKPYKGKDFGLERLCLRCCYILGVGYEKTAELMDVSRATVYRIMNYMSKAAV